MAVQWQHFWIAYADEEGGNISNGSRSDEQWIAHKARWATWCLVRLGELIM